MPKLLHYQTVVMREGLLSVPDQHLRHKSWLSFNMASDASYCDHMLLRTSAPKMVWLRTNLLWCSLSRQYLIYNMFFKILCS